MGRQTKLTPAVQDRICAAIKAGNYLKAAAGAGGITERSLYLWLSRGSEERAGKYRALYDQVQEAEAEAERLLVEHWQAHTPEDWRASAEFLSRRFPERWGNKAKLDVSADVNAKVESKEPPRRELWGKKGLGVIKIYLELKISPDGVMEPMGTMLRLVLDAHGGDFDQALETIRRWEVEDWGVESGDVEAIPESGDVEAIPLEESGVEEAGIPPSRGLESVWSAGKKPGLSPKLKGAFDQTGDDDDDELPDDWRP